MDGWMKAFRKVSEKSFNFMGIWHINCGFICNSLCPFWHIWASPKHNELSGSIGQIQPKPLWRTCTRVLCLRSSVQNSSILGYIATLWMFTQAFLPVTAKSNPGIPSVDMWCTKNYLQCRGRDSSVYLQVVIGWISRPIYFKKTNSEHLFS